MQFLALKIVDIISLDIIVISLDIMLYQSCNKKKKYVFNILLKRNILSICFLIVLTFYLFYYMVCIVLLLL